MARRAIIVRHAESTANANETVTDFDAVPLSGFGRRQAESLAEAFPFAPDRIAVSRMPRTLETAIPLARRYPEASIEEWNIHEFVPVYLEPGEPASISETQKAFDEYWRRSDPFWIDGRPGVESFSGAVARIADALERIGSASGERLAIVSHGRFIRIMEAYVNRPEVRGDLPALMRFAGISEPVANAAILEFDFDPSGRISGLRRLPA